MYSFIYKKSYYSEPHPMPARAAPLRQVLEAAAGHNESIEHEHPLARISRIGKRPIFKIRRLEKKDPLRQIGPCSPPATELFFCICTHGTKQTRYVSLCTENLTKHVGFNCILSHRPSLLENESVEHRSSSHYSSCVSQKPRNHLDRSYMPIVISTIADPPANPNSPPTPYDTRRQNPQKNATALIKNKDNQCFLVMISCAHTFRAYLIL
jgi:hypothetical protein